MRMEDAIIHKVHLKRNEAAPIRGIDQNKSAVDTIIVGGEKHSPVERLLSRLCAANFVNDS